MSLRGGASLESCSGLRVPTVSRVVAPPCGLVVTGYWLLVEARRRASGRRDWLVGGVPMRVADPGVQIFEDLQWCPARCPTLMIVDGGVFQGVLWSLTRGVVGDGVGGSCGDSSAHGVVKARDCGRRWPVRGDGVVSSWWLPSSGWSAPWRARGMESGF